MKINSLALIALFGSLMFSCSKEKQQSQQNNESYTVVKENGDEKVVTTDRDEEIINSADLPDKANQFLKNNFGSEIIKNTTKELDKSGNEFKVQLSNGIKIDFDTNGEWKKVEAGLKDQSVGTIFLPQIARDYLKQNYPEIGVQSIERDERGIDVELLQQNVDLKFDTNGKFLRID